MTVETGRICVVGLGYIGLPTAAMLASRGHQVIGVDTNPAVVESINQGRPHFHEPDLQMLLRAAVGTGNMTAGLVPEPADFFVIAVPTPVTASQAPELCHVFSACDAIAPFLAPGNTVILESTSPVHTTEHICDRLAHARPDLSFPRFRDTDAAADIFVAHCPERVLPGRMLIELVANARIVGGMTEACARRAASLYGSFVQNEPLLTDCRTAEFVKLIENAYRDVNIAFANELSMLADHHGIDVWSAIGLANRHPRVEILNPGAGVGGHCIAIDPWFLVAGAPDMSKLIRTAREVNMAKPDWVLSRLRAMAAKLKDPVVACFGITYKADVDDLRESPALEIVAELAADGGIKVIVVDPHVKVLPHRLAVLKNVTLMGADEARDAADVIVLLVAHRQFQSMRHNAILNKMVFDAVGLLR